MKSLKTIVENIFDTATDEHFESVALAKQINDDIRDILFLKTRRASIGVSDIVPRLVKNIKKYCKLSGREVKKPTAKQAANEGLIYINSEHIWMYIPANQDHAWKYAINIKYARTTSTARMGLVELAEDIKTFNRGKFYIVGKQEIGDLYY